jgi:hypothetical protein
METLRRANILQSLFTSDFPADFSSRIQFVQAEMVVALVVQANFTEFESYRSSRIAVCIIKTVLT